MGLPAQNNPSDADMLMQDIMDQLNAHAQLAVGDMFGPTYIYGLEVSQISELDLAVEISAGQCWLPSAKPYFIQEAAQGKDIPDNEILPNLTGAIRGRIFERSQLSLQNLIGHVVVVGALP